WVLWEYRDPSNATYMTVGVSGNEGARSELDPSGADAGTTSPSGPRTVSGEDLTYPGFADLFSGQCFLDGIAAPCGVTSQLLRSGAGVEADSSIASGLKRRKKKPSEPSFPNPKDNPKDPSDPDPLPTRTAPTLMIRAGAATIQEQIPEFEGGGHKRQRPRAFNFWEDLPILIGVLESPQKAIDKAVEDARAILQPEGQLGADNSCARFFGGSANATAVL